MATPSRLLALPSELWIYIGRLVIDQEDPIPDSPWCRNSSSQNLRLSQPSITRVCHSLRTELLPYYYRTKASLYLHEDSYDWVLHRTGEWLRAIGPHARRQIPNSYVLSSKTVLNAYEFTFDSLREKWWRVEFEVSGPIGNPPEERKPSDFAYRWIYRVTFL